MNILRRFKTMFKRKPKKECKMILKSRDMGDGKYEVDGIVFYADSHAEAIRKFRRANVDTFMV